MTVTIRPGGWDDLANAVDIYFVASTARRDGRPIENWRMAEVTEEVANPDAWLFMAEDAGLAVGMASAAPSKHEHGAPEPIAGLCYLGFIFVLPDRWGEGIGAQLLDQVMLDAVERGFTRIHLWTHENNVRAHAMYERRGFVRTGRAHPSGNDPEINVEEWERPL